MRAMPLAWPVTLAIVNGVIVVDKPREWTSHDVVNRIRRLANTRKVGHLGTLDPGATGVLPLVLGKATRLAQFYTKNEKTYESVIHFGYSTDSYDADGEMRGSERSVTLDRDALEAVLARFRGEFAQTPPPVSAKKIAGKPAYLLARKGQTVEMQPVPVTVHSLELLSIDGCQAKVRLRCSAGTYVRSIAHDTGQAMGCGAHLRDLRRMASGEFKIGQARTLDELGALAEAGRLAEALIPAAQLLPDFPVELVDPITAGQIRNGRDFRVSPFHTGAGARFVKAVETSGELLAIGEARLPNLYHPILVI